MSNLFKKVTSASMALLIVLTIVRPFAGVMAAYTSLEAANKLASLGVIVDNSANPANYRLGDTITRGEMAKITMKLAGSEVSNTYAGKFSDLTAGNWVTKYAEAGLAAGYFAANSTFRPADSVTKIEALKMVMKAKGVEKSSNTDWKAAYVEAAVEANILESSFSDYDVKAERGFIFQTAVNAVEGSTDSSDDLLGDLIGDTTDTTDTTTGSTDTTDTTDTTTSTNGTLTVSLSPETPTGATVPAGISGLPVAKFDLTAGSEDVTVTSLTLARKGLSDLNTLAGLAVFTADGRVSKSKDDSQNDNTEAQLTLTNGLVVKAGETKTITVVADVKNALDASGDEFAVQLKEVVASTSVETEGSLVANTMKVGSINAATLTLKTDGTVSNPKLGDSQVDLFKFKATGTSNEDITLKSVTFKSDVSDAEEDFTNLKLYQGTTLVSEAKGVVGKYVTFNLGNGIVVGKNKTERFVVKGDVVSGAADVVSFYVDKQLDITAQGNTYGYGAGVDVSLVSNAGNLGTLTIQAGALTVNDVDADATDIREDKDNVVLGKIVVTNIAGKDLEIQKFNVDLVATLNSASAAVVTGVASLLENIELLNEKTGTSYDLTLAGNGMTTTAGDNDLNIALPQGETTFLVRADTKKPSTIGAFDTVTVKMSANLGNTTYFKVVETNDDKVVTDITPSSLDYKKLTFVKSAATVSLTPLSNVKVVRGAKGVVALQFQVEAGKTSALTIDQAKVLLQSGAINLTNSQISEVALYKDSVSDSNLLDKVSGSNLASGVATFDGFTVNVAKSAKQTFVVTASIVDGSSVAGTVVKATLPTDGLTVRDEDNDDVAITGLNVSSSRAITVSDAGTLAIVADSNNTDNKDSKTILAGDSTTVFSADVQSTNEKTDVEVATFTVNADLRNAVTTASLYLGDTLIATNSNADITATTVTFKDLTTLLIPTDSTELRLKLNTANIGYEKVGQTLTGVTVTNVALTKVEGVDSGKPVADAVLASTSANTFAIVPAAVVASVNSSFGNSADLKLTVSAGANTTSTNNTPKVTVTNLVFADQGNSTVTYKVKDSNGVVLGTGASNGGDLNIALSGSKTTFSSNETYTIEAVLPAATGNYTWGLKLKKDGVKYTTDASGAAALTNSMTDTLNLGSSSKSN